ncbi:hypothetical protein [Janibacter sp. HTCC2649]|uniref:hypothetical protein n=1 Tax=Janibacter sp. HTCC2649 TaxID=313589 RepID=UPI000323831B|nr:hypothetical protein [Janibacter sp. HTCC2649]
MTSTVFEPRARRVASSMRLLVTTRDPHTRQYRPVGFLTEEAGHYTFAYLRRELERSDFRPLPGLVAATKGPMSSGHLFPLFAERVISSRRPDRRDSFEALGLPIDAAPMEVLARSHGQRVGDTVELLSAPSVGIGDDVSFTFLTHGVRYLAEREQERISDLVPLEPLRLVVDHGNEVNPKAQLVTDTDEIRLGWLPDPLIDVVESVENPQVVVEQANGPEVGFHFRLLVRFTGRATAEIFSGPSWDTL